MTNFNIYSSKFGQSTDDLPEGEVNLYLTNERIQAVIDSHTNLVKLTQLTWNNITNKPGTFPLSTHSHSWTEITSKPTTFTPSSHTHTIANVTGLQSTLDGKEPTFTKNTAFNKNFGTTTGTVTEGNDVRLSNARTPTSHTHTLSQITDSGNVAAIDTNGSTSNYLRGDGVWVTPPNTTYSAGTGLTLVGTEFRNTAPNVSTNLSTSTTSNTLTVNSSDGTNAVLPGATTALAGVMTGADKTKLNGIAAGAQVNVATNLTVSTTATNVTVNSSTGDNATIPAATTTVAGVMSNADKTKLDGIAAGAQVNVATNLGVTAGTTAGPVVTSSTGTNVTLPTASATNSGIITTGNQTWTGVKTFNSLITGSISGNAGTATALQTARTINGTSFNGTANITTVNWGTARTLTIGSTGKSVNGSGNVSWSLATGFAQGSSLLNQSPGSSWRFCTVQRHKNSAISQTMIPFGGEDIYQRNRVNAVWSSWQQLAFTSSNITGNAATATTLQTARTINGTSFNGSANITITANTPNTLTNGTGLTGNNFNGSAATTWAVAYGKQAQPVKVMIVDYLTLGLPQRTHIQILH
ncbi:beta strand repeat-containing protein [Limnospira platensis]|uniref:beta strand repeat-containing protein n=2 Tax=Limnospira platensis TaxID=118562 RepID=UPI003D6F48EA